MTVAILIVKHHFICQVTMAIPEIGISYLVPVEMNKQVSMNTQADFIWGLLLELEASCSSKTVRLAQTKEKLQLLWHL